ncbi:type VII secretion integral membrane protein EccD [Streptomyces sp. NPDC005122]
MTIVGTRRRVDLAVPAGAAIAEYMPTLLRLAGQVEADSTFPPVWSLALPGARPLPPETSLRDAGIVDGSTLHLRDFAAGEFDEPVVTDLEESVEQVGNGAGRWGRHLRAHTSLILGVLSVTAGFATLVVRHPAQPAVGVTAIAVAFALVMLGWHATRQGWSLPQSVRLAMVEAAIPLLAMAAVSLPAARAQTGALFVAAALGATLGAVTAALAVRHVVTLMSLALTAVAVPLTVGLVMGHADVLEAAAVVAVVVLGVLSAAPKGAGHLAVMAAEPGENTTDEAGIARLVTRGRRLLIGINTLCSVLLGACLVVLGTADQTFALLLAVCMGLTLILRSGQLTVTSAVVPVVCAGLVGLVTAVLHGPTYFGAPDGVGPVLLLIAAVIGLGLGLNIAFRSQDEEEERPAWLDPLAGFLAVVCVPLAVGVFGVYASVLDMGQSL